VSKRKRDGSISEKSRRSGADFFTKNQANLVAPANKINPAFMVEFILLNVKAPILRDVCKNL